MDDFIAQRWKTVEDMLAQMNRPKRMFEINPAKTALFVIDMQNVFVAEGASIELPKGREIAAAINLLTKECRRIQIPVIRVQFILKTDGSDGGLWPLFHPTSPRGSDRRPPLEEISDEEGTKIWKGLDVNYGKDFFIKKTR